MGFIVIPCYVCVSYRSSIGVHGHDGQRPLLLLHHDNIILALKYIEMDASLMHTRVMCLTLAIFI